MYVDSSLNSFVTFPGNLSDAGYLYSNEFDCYREDFALGYVLLSDLAITSDSVRYGYKPTSDFTSSAGLYCLKDPVPPAYIFGWDTFIEFYEEDTLIQGLTCDTTGILYAAGKGLTTFIDDNSSNSEIYQGDFPNDIQCQGDITMYQGTLYMVAMGNKLVEVNAQNPSLSQVLWEFSTNIPPIHGLATIKIECDSSITYAIGKNSNGSSLYRIDYENQFLVEICDVPEKVILGAASYSECAPAPCDIIVDLDFDDSSGGVENNFIADTSCTPPIPIVDSDVTILSEPGRLDSLTIMLSGIIDTGVEYLALNIANSLTIVGSGTDKISLINDTGLATLNDFEQALSNILYQNDAPSPTYGTRDAIFIAYATVYESEPSVAWITLSNEGLQFNPTIDNPNCFGENNGEITVNPSGGMSPYTVEWFDAQMGNTISNLGEGNYNVTIIDDTGCQRIDTIELMQPDSLIVMLENMGSTIVCDNSGALNTNVQGGTMPYSYLWNDGNTDANRTGLSAGLYSVEVTDINGCTDFSEYELVEDTLYVNQTEQLCFGEVFDFNNEDFDSDTSLCLTFTAFNGCDSIHCLDLQFVDTTYAEQFAEICFGEDFNFNGIILENDTSVCITLTNSSGCDSLICLNLSVLENTTQLTDEFCENETYVFNGQEISESGVYFDTLTAFNGCDSLIVLELQTNPAPISNIEIDGNLCLDDEVTISIDPAFEYIWQTGETTSSITVTEAGTYLATATNAFGCQSVFEAAISEEADLTIFYSAQSPVCFGDVFGSIEVDSVTGGVSPYLYALNGESLQSNTSFEDLISGDYELLIEDANGCQAITNINLTEPQLLTVDIGENPSINLGEVIDLSAITNNQDVFIEWIPSEGLSCDDCLNPIAQPITSTTYTVIITDAQGCTAMDKIEISVNNIVGIYAPNAFSPNNDGFNDFFTAYADASIESILTFRVFDRWGGLLFETSDIPPNEPSLGWNGQAGGEVLESGIYLYFMEVLRIDGVKEILRGDVLLSR